MRRTIDIATQLGIGAAMLIGILACLVLVCVMGVLLIPYNAARITAWVLEKILNGISWVIANIEAVL